MKINYIESGDVKFEVDQSLYPFKSNFIKVKKGVTIHYVDEGIGPVILMG